MLKNILSLISGIVIGLLIILIIRVMILTRFPFSETMDWFSVPDRNEYIASLPEEGLWYYIFAHILGAFFGALITALIPNKWRFIFGMTATAIIVGYTIIESKDLIYPEWHRISDPVITLSMGMLGAYIGSRRVVK